MSQSTRHAPLADVVGSWPISRIGGTPSTLPNTVTSQATILGALREPSAGYDVDGRSFFLWVDGVRHTVSFVYGAELPLSEVISQINTAVGASVAFNDNGFLRLSSTTSGSSSSLRLETNPASSPTDVFYNLGLFSETEAYSGDLQQAQHVDPDRQVALPGQMAISEGESFTPAVFNRAIFQLALNNDRNEGLLSKKRLVVDRAIATHAYVSPGSPEGYQVSGGQYVFVGSATSPTEAALEKLVAVLDADGREFVKKKRATVTSAIPVDVSEDPESSPWSKLTATSGTPFLPVHATGNYYVVTSDWTGASAALDDVPLKIMKYLSTTEVLVAAVDPSDGTEYDLEPSSVNVDLISITPYRAKVDGIYDTQGGSRVEGVATTKHSSVAPSRVDKNNRVVAVGQDFLSSPVVEGDVLEWSGAIQLPFDNNGTYRVSKVIDKETLELVNEDWSAAYLNSDLSGGAGTFDITTDGQFVKDPFFRFATNGAPEAGDQIQILFRGMSNIREATDDPTVFARSRLFDQEVDDSVQKAILKIYGPSAETIDDVIYGNVLLNLESQAFRVSAEHYDTGRHSTIRPDRIAIDIEPSDTASVVVRRDIADAYETVGFFEAEINVSSANQTQALLGFVDCNLGVGDTRGSAIGCYSLLDKDGAGELTTYYGYRAYYDIDGGGDVGALRSFYSSGNVDDGNVTDLDGVRIASFVGASGTVVNNKGFYFDNAGGTGTITNQYGAHIDNLTRGSVNNYGVYVGGASGGSGENWAVWVDSGTSRFDQLTVGATSHNADNQAYILNETSTGADTDGAVRAQTAVTGGPGVGEKYGVNAVVNLTQTAGTHSGQVAGVKSVIRPWTGHASTVSTVKGYDVQLTNNGTPGGAITNFYGYYSRVNCSGYTLGDLRHFEATNATGGGTIANQYGLFVGTLDEAANNIGVYVQGVPQDKGWAIYSADGLHYLNHTHTKTTNDQTLFVSQIANGAGHSGQQRGIYVQATANYTSAISGALHGIQVAMEKGNPSADNAYVGFRATLTKRGTPSGTLGTYYGYFSEATPSDFNVTSIQHYHVSDATGTGAVTNQYGFYADAMTKGTNNYAIYTAGATKSYFGGNVGVNYLPDDNITLYARRTTTAAGAQYAFLAYHDITGAGITEPLQAVNAYTKVSHGAGASTDVRGVFSRLEKSGVGDITSYKGFWSYVGTADGGDITNLLHFSADGIYNHTGIVATMYGLNIATPSGSGNIASCYGIRVAPQTFGSSSNYGLYIGGASGGSTTNYSIWVDSGDCRFDGNCRFDGDLILYNTNTIEFQEAGAERWSIRQDAVNKLHFEWVGSPAVTLDGTGGSKNVGIGTTSPDARLHVVADADTTYRMTSEENLQPFPAGTQHLSTIEFEGRSLSRYNLGAKISVRQDGTWSTVSEYYSPAAIEFYTQDQSVTDTMVAPRMYITSQGHVFPGTTVAYDLGDITHEWQRLHVHGGTTAGIVTLGGRDHYPSIYARHTSGRDCILVAPSNDFLADTTTASAVAVVYPYVNAAANDSVQWAAFRVSHGATLVDTFHVNKYGDLWTSGDLHVQRSVGDARLILEADTDNDNEDDNPYVKFIQDGGAVASLIGHCNTGKDPAGGVYGNVLQNALFIGIVGNNYPIQFGINGNVAMTLDTNGRLGINQTVPNEILDVGGNILFSMSSDDRGLLGYAGAVHIGTFTRVSNDVRLSSYADIRFHVDATTGPTAGAEKMRVNTTGVCIGSPLATNLDSSDLNVHGAGAKLLVSSSSETINAVLKLADSAALDTQSLEIGYDCDSSPALAYFKIADCTTTFDMIRTDADDYTLRPSVDIRSYLGDTTHRFRKVYATELVYSNESGDDNPRINATATYSSWYFDDGDYFRYTRTGTDSGDLFLFVASSSKLHWDQSTSEWKFTGTLNPPEVDDYKAQATKTISVKLNASHFHPDDPASTVIYDSARVEYKIFGQERVIGSCPTPVNANGTFTISKLHIYVDALSSLEDLYVYLRKRNNSSDTTATNAVVYQITAGNTGWLDLTTLTPISGSLPETIEQDHGYTLEIFMGNTALESCEFGGMKIDYTMNAVPVAWNF